MACDIPIHGYHRKTKANAKAWIWNKTRGSGLGTWGDANKTKNKLYVALTRSLNELSIYILKEVEDKYTKKRILDFFEGYLWMWRREGIISNLGGYQVLTTIAKKVGDFRKLLALAVTVTMEEKNQPIEMWGMSIWEIVEFFGKILDLRCRNNYEV